MKRNTFVGDVVYVRECARETKEKLQKPYAPVTLRATVEILNYCSVASVVLRLSERHLCRKKLLVRFWTPSSLFLVNGGFIQKELFRVEGRRGTSAR